MRTTRLRHKFVDLIPKELEESTIYISIPYGTVAHKCACGCGNEVVTPLGKTGWSITYDGEDISLHPSIGNWGFACKSHYWIRESRVEYAAPWQEKKPRVQPEKVSWWRILINFFKQT